MTSKGLKSLCFLRSLGSILPDIALPDGQDVTIGRGPDTKIKDRRCSRQQLKLRANTQLRSVRLEVCGDNASSVTAASSSSSSTITKGDIVDLHDSDVVHILKDLFPFKVVIGAPTNESNARKRQAITDNETIKHPHKVTKTSQAVTSSSDWDINEIYQFKELKTLRDDENFRWEHMADTVYIMTTKGCVGRSKIAAFDIDHTLIAPSSGRVFPVDRNDWKLIWPETKSRLRDLHNTQDFKIVFFTNQGGLASGQTTLADFTFKMEALQRSLRVPFQLFCSASSRGMFRKPRVGLWELMKRYRNDSVSIDMDNSFYCGDAAGRLKDWMPKKRKDFSSSDRLFAQNLSLKFKTPEEFFLDHKPTEKFSMPEFDPTRLKEEERSLLDPESSKLFSETQEVIMMVGMQGSGKSCFVRKHISPNPNYVVVSNDITGSRDKSIRLMEEKLKQGKSVVVDNTHVDVEARQRFMDVVKKFANVGVRCFVMTTTIEHAMHNDVFRDVTDPDHVKLKHVTLYTYRKRFQPPTLSEGFSEVVNVNFVPSFDNKALENLYFSYLLEK